VTLDINLKEKKTFGVIEVSIFDVNGRLLITNRYQDLGKINIAINKIGAGNYFIRTSIDHKPVSIQKLVKM